jgi:hypothetical protein
MNGNLVTINGVNYTVASYIDPTHITLSTSAGVHTNVAYKTGAFACSVAPTTLTLSGGGYTVQATGSFNTSGSVVTKTSLNDVGAGYTSVPTVTFNGTCTQPPVALAYIGGANNAGTSAWCADHNLMPGAAWPGEIAMYPYPTAQGDSSAHNGCDSPTGGGNLGNTSTLSTWENVGFVNWVRDNLGAECSTLVSGCVGSTPAATGDLHLSSSSPGHNAANDGTDIGANMDLVIGTSSGTPSPYTGISINSGILVLPQ